MWQRCLCVPVYQQSAGGSRDTDSRQSPLGLLLLHISLKACCLGTSASKGIPIQAESDAYRNSIVSSHDLASSKERKWLWGPRSGKACLACARGQVYS